LEGLLGGVGDNLGDGVAVLVGMLGEQSAEVTFQGLAALTPLKLDAERVEELGQFGQRGGGGMRYSSRFHALSTISTN
jgi:hypothetical protein